MSLGKPEAMKRHIETCIKMMALGLDPVSTHVIVMASQEMLRSYAQATGAPLRFDEDDFILEHRRAEWRRAKVRAYNFFKHSDRDAGAVLPVEVVGGLPTVNELQTLFNTFNYQHMFSGWPDGGGLFVVMSMVLYSDIFDIDKMFAQAPELQRMFEDVRHIDRDTVREFIRSSLERDGLLSPHSIVKLPSG